MSAAEGKQQQCRNRWRQRKQNNNLGTFKKKKKSKSPVWLHALLMAGCKWRIMTASGGT